MAAHTTHKSERRCIKCILLLFIIILSTLTLSAQSKYATWDDFMAKYFSEEAPDPTTYAELVQLNTHPLNINKVDKNELLRIPFLNTSKADSILSYRNKKKHFTSLGDFLLIKGLTYEDRCFLPLFVYVGDYQQKRYSLNDWIISGIWDIHTRLAIPFYRKSGFKSHQYLGQPFYHFIKTEYNFHHHLRYGIIFEKDEGEPIANYKNCPYDYISGYIDYVSPHQHSHIIIGDFQISGGNGLLFNHSLFHSKIYALSSLSYNNFRIIPHTSRQEYQYFRGISYSYTHRLFHHTAFVSLTPIDAHIMSDSIHSLPENGLHRTWRELSNRNRDNRYSMGYGLEYILPDFRIGILGTYTHFQHNFSKEWYNIHSLYLLEKNNFNFSTSYFLNGNHYKMKGEIAVDKGFHFSALNTLMLHPNESLRLTGQIRYLNPYFTSPFGRCLQNGNHCSNEISLLIGGTYFGIRNVELKSYFDIFIFPHSTRYRPKASKGFDFFIEAQYPIYSHNQWLLRYQAKNSQQYVSGYKNLSEYQFHQKIKLQFQHTTLKYHLSTAVAIKTYHSQTQPLSLGGMWSSRINYPIAKQLEGTSFLAVFYSPNYSTRLYTYEPSLRYERHISTFFHKGLKLAQMIRWNSGKRITLHFKYAFLLYFHQHEIGSGLEKIYSPLKNDIAIECHMQF